MEEDKKHSHNERMSRKKAVIDAAIERAQDVRGIFIVITGNGKGKTTSAFGTAYRALGHGQRVGVVQFIKGTQATGEVMFLHQRGLTVAEDGPAAVEYHAMATGFTWNTQNWDEDKRAADEAWAQAVRMLADPGLQLVVLDELTYMLKYNYLDTAAVLAAIQARPAHQTVIVTGRAAKPELIEAADTVSELADRKHAFKAGVKAQAGVDF
ncbi:MAG: cob(I)yrinic acid a,c-diamide adenosyltransferase [Thauera sp.]|jgi:cob(I)alamin adenosyltransferase|nr:cob(I)yrinic acid a,c-diamide adenosyltransferase [Thauera sp.]